MTATKIVLNNRRFVLVPEADWVKATSVPARSPAVRAGTSKRGSLPKGETLPPLPRPDRHGNRPALAFADASIARDIIQRRRRLGLSQAGLAKLAGVRVEVLNRAERAVTVPTLRTLAKIEAVLGHLERRAASKRG